MRTLLLLPSNGWVVEVKSVPSGGKFYKIYKRFSTLTNLNKYKPKDSEERVL